MHSDKQIKNPVLSVIMPAYNSEKYIARAIESILDQTFSDFELLICDDGSTDKTLEIISFYCKNDGRIKPFVNRQNLGKTTSVNNLYKVTTGKFITIHDSDDISLESRFEKQLNVLREDCGMAFCGANFFTIDENENIIGESKLNSSTHSLKQGLYNSSQFHGPTVIFQKKVLNQLKLIYRPFFNNYNEDYDLCFRAAELGKTTNLNTHLYQYRLTRNSLSRTLTPQKRCSPKIVQYLAVQRKNNNGIDDLMVGNIENLENILAKLTVHYQVDPSLINREQAEHDFYYGFYRDALKNALRAVSKRPTKIRNYRLLQHLLRKRIFGI